MPFKKGNKIGIGNKGQRDAPKKRQERRMISSAVEEALRKQINDGKNPSKYIDRIATRLVKIAATGKASDAIRAIREIMDRLEGRPAQKVEVTGKDRGPIQMITREMSDAEAARIVQAMIREDDEED